MEKQIGLWIDHDRAVIMTMSERGEDIQKIESGVGRQIHYRGPTRPRTPYSARYQQGDDQLDKKFIVHLNKFYDRVIARIRTADSVLIFGPGEAKTELGKRMVHQKVKMRIIGIEAADKMTERQMAARVRSRFRKPGKGT